MKTAHLGMTHTVVTFGATKTTIVNRIGVPML
jgi:hypothetical protein